MKLITWTRTGADSDSITFRIIFVSPFFELEVRNGGQKWQSVRSQKLVITDGGENTLQQAYYPMMHFPSHKAAELYATETLGLTQRAHRWWHVFARNAAPASSDAQQRRYDFSAAEALLAATTQPTELKSVVTNIDGPCGELTLAPAVVR